MRGRDRYLHLTIEKESNGQLPAYKAGLLSSHPSNISPHLSTNPTPSSTSRNHSKVPTPPRRTVSRTPPRRTDSSSHYSSLSPSASFSSQDSDPLSLQVREHQMRESRPLRPAPALNNDRVRRGSRGSDGSEASLQSFHSFQSIQSQRSERSEQQSLDQQSLDQRSLDQRSLDQRSLDQRSLDQRSLDQRSLDQQSVDERYGHEYPEFRSDLVDSTRKRYSLNSESSSTDMNINNNYPRESRTRAISAKAPVVMKPPTISRALESLLSPIPQKRAPIYNNNPQVHHPVRCSSQPPNGKEENVFGRDEEQNVRPESRHTDESVPAQRKGVERSYRHDLNHELKMKHYNNSRHGSEDESRIKHEYEPRKRELFEANLKRGQEKDSVGSCDVPNPGREGTGVQPVPRRPMSDGSLGSGFTDPALFSPTSLLSPALPRRDVSNRWVC